jgi:hypothetical protein
VRFHRPDSGIGFSVPAAASIRAARALAALCPLWETAPAQHLLRDRLPNEAYLAAKPGSAYALYFPDGGAVGLDMRGHDGRFELHWMDITSGRPHAQQVVRGGDWLEIGPPAKGHWAAALVRLP